MAAAVSLHFGTVLEKRIVFSEAQHIDYIIELVLKLLNLQIVVESKPGAEESVTVRIVIGSEVAY